MMCLPIHPFVAYDERSIRSDSDHSDSLWAISSNDFRRFQGLYDDDALE